jgi:hypothetical protein
VTPALASLKRDKLMDVCGSCGTYRYGHGQKRYLLSNYPDATVSVTLDGSPICDDFQFAGRKRYYLYGVGMWIVILAVAVLLGWALPPLRLSVVSLVAAAFGSGHYNDPANVSLGGWPYYAFITLAAFMLASGDRIYRYARREEEQYRKGSEHWSPGRRVSSCVRFGLIHFWNLVIPLSAVVALMLAGAYLMGIYLARYRKTLNQEIALATATHAHVAYNRVVLVAIGIVFGLLLLATVLR